MSSLIRKSHRAGFFPFPTVGTKGAEHPLPGREICCHWANTSEKAQGTSTLKLSFLGYFIL